MNIIYVDDEQIQRENFRLTVEGMKGMESLKLFGSSVEAYEWAKEHPVDIAFCDIEIPHINGIELAKKLKELNRKTCIIFVTAYDQYTLEAFKVRATAYLLKPYTRSDVEAELENAYWTTGNTLDKKIMITTMPDLLVTVNGRNLFQAHGKQEELFALLVDRGKSGITKGDALNCLGDGKTPKDSTYWSWLFRLKNILEEAGLSDLIATSGNTKYIRTEKVDCDLYRMLEGDTESIEKYVGKYLRRYAWAEERIAELNEIKKSYEKKFR